MCAKGSLGSNSFATDLVILHSMNQYFPMQKKKKVKQTKTPQSNEAA